MKFPAIFAIASLGTALAVLTLANYPRVTPPSAAKPSSAHARTDARSLMEKLRDNVKQTLRRL